MLRYSALALRCLENWWGYSLASWGSRCEESLLKGTTSKRDSLQVAMWHSPEPMRTNAKPFPPYSIQKRPEPQICPKFVPAIVFWGFQSGGQKFEINCQNLSENDGFSNFDKFFQIFDPLTGTPKNNRWDKFWTNLGFGAFLNAVRGKRFRKQRGLLRICCGAGREHCKGVLKISKL